MHELVIYAAFGNNYFRWKESKSQPGTITFTVSILQIKTDQDKSEPLKAHIFEPNICRFSLIMQKIECRILGRTISLVSNNIVETSFHLDIVLNNKV